MTEVPEDVVDEAERLTRLARRVGDDEEAAAYRERRDDLLAEHDFEVRVREEDDSDTLVCYPEEWLEDGTVRVERIEDTDRAAERSLSRGGEAEEWETVEEHNRAIVESVRETYGESEAANARAFADFMGNHYSRRMETATRAELREFRAEYYPRNVWPTDEQEAALERSLRAVFEIAGERYPA
ncbi:rnhA operon protein [Salarchaeum sp. JOR-1]|uniref:DUF7108 family protein n=1 Tax=Salarchaeum sp. JOR-1 TaxID=2599399 RepID=UPI0011985F83|nr:rnhA operon protein [Salarchaeum sp. JOR-1]QDX39803.1 rnhA operon protein [Salarchaeum sp. JOR-1]